MGRKAAVAIVHGIGRTVPDFADKITHSLNRLCYETCGDDLVIRSVYWARALQDDEDELWSRLKRDQRMDYKDMRRLMIDFVADAIAYQVTPHDRRAYDNIHRVLAETLRTLARDAGPDAPLCIIAHSLGTIIASNYIYDQQTDPIEPILPMTVRDAMTDTPLERLETLSLLFTLGSPLALWSLRYFNFGKPITVPDPRIVQHYPALGGAWINFYDQDDVIGYPLKPLNEEYDRAVTADIEVNIGSMLTSWSPVSHLHYWEDSNVIKPIANMLMDTWRAIQG